VSTKLKYAAGRNIAMKLPPHVYEATLRFYRDVLGLKEITKHAPSVGFEFGSNNLWLDRVPGLSQAETWLEIVTNDIAAASAHLEAAGVVRCDEIEPLPEGFQAFWISSPASIIHLVCDEKESWA
jgi:catechol 2,3-dioxygenase-like lactoylglutathione lyase family enzyme